MEQDDIWRAIDEQRIRLTDLLDGLSDEQWRTPSLCAGWTVRDVAAHLTLAQAQLPEILADFLRHPAGMKRGIRDSALRRSAVLSTGEIVARIRGMVGSQQHIAVVTCRETLIDILVHSQDIAIPLGVDLPLRPDAAAEAASRVWRSGYPFWARRRFAGFRLSATDADWSAGAGRPVRAPIAAILLLLTGRTVALRRVSGDGAPALVSHLTPA